MQYLPKSKKAFNLCCAQNASFVMHIFDIMLYEHCLPFIALWKYHIHKHIRTFGSWIFSPVFYLIFCWFQDFMSRVANSLTLLSRNISNRTICTILCQCIILFLLRLKTYRGLTVHKKRRKRTKVYHNLKCPKLQIQI